MMPFNRISLQIPDWLRLKVKVKVVKHEIVDMTAEIDTRQRSNSRVEQVKLPPPRDVKKLNK